MRRRRPCARCSGSPSCAATPSCTSGSRCGSTGTRGAAGRSAPTRGCTSRAGSPDYVAIASALLLAVSDADAQAPRTTGDGRAHYDRFARLHAFNDVLYGRSPRYERAHHHRSAWRCRGRYRPGDPAPAQREERFPALWDRAPAVLWRLLVEAASVPVIEFAARALRDHRAYIATLPDDTLGRVLATGHVIAQQLAFDMVRDRPLTIALARGAAGAVSY